MAKKQIATEIPALSKQPQELRISLPPDSKLKGEIKGFAPNGLITVKGQGKVTAYNMDKYGCSLTIELDSLSVDQGMGGDIKKMKQERTY